MNLTAIKDILLSEDKLFDLARKSFDEVDLDKSGQIELPELTKVLQGLALMFNHEPPTSEDVAEVMAHLDTDNSFTIDFNEFVVLVKDILYAMLEIQIDLGLEEKIDKNE